MAVSAPGPAPHRRVSRAAGDDGPPLGADSVATAAPHRGGCETLITAAISEGSAGVMDRASGPGSLATLYVCARVHCDLYLCLPAPSGSRPGPDLPAHHWQGHTASYRERERRREGEREGESGSGREGERREGVRERER